MKTSKYYETYYYYFIVNLVNQSYFFKVLCKYYSSLKSRLDKELKYLSEYLH